MTTQLIQSPKPRQAKVVHNLTWEQLEEIDRSLEDFPGMRLAYLDGTLEIMPISPEHENFKSTISRLLETYLDETDIRYYRRGGPSYGNKELGARNEPDESYNLDSRKSFPDLVIEVVISSGGVNKLEGYRRMGVTEVWFWEDGVLQINHLRETGYELVSRSELLPGLPLDLFRRYITYHDQYDAVREFRQALRKGFGRGDGG
ncbi:Uma2 family endonuclease (plasmid) [Kovacikia minuta CCNUW1]|uniref:Uma2 family endonuclease n=1 Tax=Kovacikia minuta TaxID=2931930 RepID=UPI001CCFD318|nr:Uma2 family endonuclease [Kovacikia minuta]UBF30524.1 Uma2 family endonuclease [Kovacikia minuta CCNUW1]